MQGGTRSGKTYNIIIWLIVTALSRKVHIDIVRQTMPSLKKTVIRDFKDIMINSFNLWSESSWRETDKIFTFSNGSMVQFFNLDDDQKVRGAKRDIIFINEANEVKINIWKQLIFRTTEKIILDYNPSDEFHWIYDTVITRDDCDFYKTTFLDNPFLPAELINEIKRLKDADPNYWRIYGLGERGVSGTTIYSNWQIAETDEHHGTVYYGLDFGFNHPTALTRITVCDGYVYVEELIYESHLTTPQIIDKMRALGVNETDDIYGDSSRPETIEEIARAGFNIYPTIKGAGSVKAGIDWVKRQKLLVSKNSTNILKEFKSYKWKVDKDERVLDEPVKINDDAMDSLRYAFNGLMQVQEGFFLGESLDVAF
jgi:phage terminase large subunit